MKLGYNTQGTEARFEHWLNVAMGTFEEFLYVEVGIAEGTTLLAVAEHLHQNNKSFHCVGYDLWPSPFFNPTRFMEMCKFPCEVHKDCTMKVEPLPGEGWKLVDVKLNDERPLIKYPSFCLIDGDHSAKSVIQDFRKVAICTNPGTIVAFHDACEDDQGGVSPQKYDPGINVRQALRELRLLPECTPYREGWKFLEEAPGRKDLNGNGFVFVQKV